MTKYLWVVGLVQAVIAAVSPVVASDQHGGLIAVIAVVGAALSAVASYFLNKGVKAAMAAAVKAAKAAKG